MVVASSSILIGSEFNEIPHVLVVDDSPIDRKIIEKILINSVCEVTTAENGKRALEFLGLEDGQQSKSKESPDMKEIPVVVMSSEDSPARIKQCLDEGAQEFLHKHLQPSDVTKLRCHIEKLKNPC